MVTMLDPTYLDLVATKAVVGIVPKPPFYPLFESMLDEQGARVRVFKPNPEGDEDGFPTVHSGQQMM